MDFELSATAQDYVGRLTDFMQEFVYPAEAVYAQQRTAAGPDDHTLPPIVEELKVQARARGLWNLFLGAESGLSNVDYAALAELTGRSPYIAPEALNCAAPDTGNMELLHMFGTDAQKKQWLEPLLDGTIRSGFSMTEPDVASSDARNIMTSIVRDGDEYVINGRKWWTTGAADPRCAVLILMGKTDPQASAYQQQSMVLVPMDAPGVEVVRTLPVFGYYDQHGHGEIIYTDVRVPVTNLLGPEGGGFAIAQARLGPGRIHHAMRCVGMAERALELMCQRAVARTAFGRPLSDQGVVQQQIAESRMEIEQVRLLVLKTAWLIDKHGSKGAATEVAAIKVMGPRMLNQVLDRAIQIHGGAGVTEDFPLARMWATARILRIADGPDEVHIRSVARTELAPYRAR
jgi:acyl-CoA dehydrogenase